MPEQEFESFLAALSKHLRLSPAQRQSVTSELRDHLETRFNDLINSGIPRDEAIRRTLDDVGDGRQLARELGSVRQIVRTRRLIRIGAALVTAAACVVLCLHLLSTLRISESELNHRAYVSRPAYAPPEDATMGAAGMGGMGGDLMLVQGGIAFGGGADDTPVAVPAPTPVKRSPGAEKRAALEARLDELWTHTVEFNDVPLKEMIQAIVDQAEGINVIFDRSLNDTGLQDTPITLLLKENVVSLRTLLTLVLDQTDEEYGAGIVLRDGVIVLAAGEKATTIEVYPVRDILAANLGPHGTGHAAVPSAGGSMMGAGGGPPGMPGMGMMVPPASGVGTNVVASPSGRLLVSAIREAMPLDPMVSEVNGLLIVRTTPAGHRELTDLLGKIRQAMDAGKSPQPEMHSSEAGAEGEPAAGAQ